MAEQISPAMAAMIQQAIADQVAVQVKTQVDEFKRKMKEEMQQEIAKLVQEGIAEKMRAQLAKRTASPIAKAKLPNRSPVRQQISESSSAKKAIEPFHAAAEPVRKTRISPKERAALRNSANESPSRAVNSARSPVRAAVQKAVSPKKVNISPTRASVRMSAIQPRFEAQSAKHDIIDPIYENTDPVKSSINKRVAEGSFMSVVKGRKEQFFFSMSLVGSGAPVREGKVKASAAQQERKRSPVRKSFVQKRGDCTGSLPDVKGDPIAESITERKNAGSPLQVIRNKAQFNTFEITPLTLSGRGIPDELRKNGGSSPMSRKPAKRVGAASLINQYKQS